MLGGFGNISSPELYASAFFALARCCPLGVFQILVFWPKIDLATAAAVHLDLRLVV